ncbi:MAG: sulfatase [Candidatus Brocadiia bacterium]
MPERGPNMLLVFADQMRGQALGCAGNAQVATPTLDRLAREGVMAPNAFANNPVCTPSRGSLLTGLYPLAHRALTNDVPVRTDIPSLGTVLKEAGYRTGYIGKWHLGGVPRDRFIPPGPERLGFDDYWAAWNCAHDYFNGRYHLDDDTTHTFPGYEPDGQTDLAEEFIRGHGREPFALVVSYGTPHAPYSQVPAEWLDLYDPPSIELRPNVPDLSAEKAARRRAILAQYYAAISALDADLGRLMATLEDEGMLRDTLVVFTSDHGDMLGSHGMRKKEQPWEESVRVPLLLRCPAALPAGFCVEAVVGITDLTPTMLDLLGVGVPGSMQGRSVAAALRGQARGPDSVPLGIPVPVDQAVAQGVPEWRGLRTSRYTYARRINDQGWVLYDNEMDPCQQRNLIAEPAAAELRKGLEATLRCWLDRTEDPFLPWRDMIRRAGLVADWNKRERYMHPDDPHLVGEDDDG